MYMIYWQTTGEVIGKSITKSKLFESDQLLDALQFSNELRMSPLNSFIVMASENPNSVGKQGAVAAGPDYDWTKRRNNERDPNVAITRRKLYNATDEQEVPLDEE